MRRRKPIPSLIETQVLDESRRRCAICYGLMSDTREKRGQIAHLDHDSANNDPKNLLFLCLIHHDAYDSKTSQSKNLKPDEVRRYRDRLYEWVTDNLPSSPDAQIGVDSTPVIESSSSTRVGSPKRYPALNLKEISSAWGTSLTETQAELARCSEMLRRVKNAQLTSRQRRLLASVIDKYQPDGLPRRIVEMAGGFGYQSREFYDEMSVLIHYGLTSHDPDLDDLVYLVESETWASIRDLCERANLPLIDVLGDPGALHFD